MSEGFMNLIKFIVLLDNPSFIKYIENKFNIHISSEEGLDLPRYRESAEYINFKNLLKEEVFSDYIDFFLKRLRNFESLEYLKNKSIYFVAFEENSNNVLFQIQNKLVENSINVKDISLSKNILNVFLEHDAVCREEYIYLLAKQVYSSIEGVNIRYFIEDREADDFENFLLSNNFSLEVI